jgi:hypothetical protein
MTQPRNIIQEGCEKPPYSVNCPGWSSHLKPKKTNLWESDLKTANLEQLCPTFTEYRLYEGAFSTDSKGAGRGQTIFGGLMIL